MKKLLLSLALLSSMATWADINTATTITTEIDAESSVNSENSLAETGVSKDTRVTIIGRCIYSQEDKLVVRQTEHILLFEETDTLEEVHDSNDFAQYSVVKDAQGVIHFRASITYMNEEGKEESFTSPFVTVELNQETGIEFRSDDGSAIAFVILATQESATNDMA